MFLEMKPIDYVAVTIFCLVAASLAGGWAGNIEANAGLPAACVELDEGQIAILRTYGSNSGGIVPCEKPVPTLDEMKAAD